MTYPSIIASTVVDQDELLRFIIDNIPIVLIVQVFVVVIVHDTWLLRILDKALDGISVCVWVEKGIIV